MNKNEQLIAKWMSEEMTQKRGWWMKKSAGEKLLEQAYQSRFNHFYAL